MLQTLTPSEEEVMQIIWKEGQIYFRDLMNIFPEPKPHQNTVSTFLKILVEKHYLNVEKQGRIYLYRPAVEFVDYRKFVLKRFLENYFNNSGGELFNILLDEELITAGDFENSIKSRAVFATKPKHENHIQDFIKEITSDKKSKKKEKDKKKKKDKKK
ncbi:BlaI/MecI/CopY family transcriptional regulator [Epilithonimonas arachidiradicis]|nr:BlaI/MecI/CopY family transcriptional regulator [Epilithonimonas arachidiradicis]